MDVLGGSSGAFISHSCLSTVRLDSPAEINRCDLQVSRGRVINVGIFGRDSTLKRHGGELKSRSCSLEVNTCTARGTLALRCGRQQGTGQEEEDAKVDIVLLSNGPGEVATWVKPVLDSLRQQSGGTKQCIRISVNLNKTFQSIWSSGDLIVIARSRLQSKIKGFTELCSFKGLCKVVLQPCPHASGREVELVKSYNQVDRCLGPESFWDLLMFGLTEDGWTWSRRGVCVFLGGDQFYTLLLSQRLGYKSIIYSEDSVRWPGLVDMYMLRSAQMLSAVPSWAHNKCKVVGDLFSDSVFGMQPQTMGSCSFARADSSEAPIPVVGLLPGSKASKLALGVPYFLADRMMGRVRFLLPLAPTATLDMIEKYADKSGNPNISRFSWASGKVSLKNERESNLDHNNEQLSDERRSQFYAVGHLVTDEDVHIEIMQQFPAYNVFKCCTLCITTVGTNTAELGYLGIPMLVVLPTHALETFKGGTGGILGLLANIPGELGNAVARSVNSALLKSSGYMAWPNRWVNKEVVPELVGRIEPVEVADIAAYYLLNSEKLDEMREQLVSIHSRPSHSEDERGQGAAEAVAVEVFRFLPPYQR